MLKGDSNRLGGTIEEAARGAVSPACREGRVSKVIDLDGGRYRLEVRIRSLMGDAKVLPARGYRPRVVEGDDGLELLHAVNGDAVWVTEDEGQQFVVVDWEPSA